MGQPKPRKVDELLHGTPEDVIERLAGLSGQRLLTD